MRVKKKSRGEDIEHYCGKDWVSLASSQLAIQRQALRVPPEMMMMMMMMMMTPVEHYFPQKEKNMFWHVKT
jgi:hypothetical protein